MFSLLCAAVLLLHKDGAQFLNIAWLALPCFAVSRVTLPSLAMAYLLSMPLSNCTNVSRIGRHSGCLVKNAPKHIRQMTKSVKTSHEQTLKSHGVKSTNGAALVDSEGHKCKQNKKCMKDPHKCYHNKNQLRTKNRTISNIVLITKILFRISLKYLKMYSIRVFFLHFFFCKVMLQHVSI